MRRLPLPQPTPRRRTRAAVSRVGVLLLALCVAAGGARAAEQELSHDDGVQINKRSMAGTGHVISFRRPSGTWWLKSVRVYGARYGGGYDPAATFFEVAVTNGDLKSLGSTRAAYEHFAAGRFDWVDVPFAEPVALPDMFKVVVNFDPTATRGVYVATCATSSSHSSMGLPGKGDRPFVADQEWMIRAVLTDVDPSEGLVELARDDGEKAGQKSLGGGAHVVEFEKPSGTWYVHSVKVYGQRYGGGYDPDATAFTVTLTSTSGKPFYEEKGAYGLFGIESYAWCRVPITEAVKAPSRFRVIVDFDPAATRGVYVGHDATKRTHSYVGRAGERARRFDDGEWMVRVVLGKEPPETPPPTAVPSHDPDVYVKDLESVAETVAKDFPAFDKKGVDWDAVVRSLRHEFETCTDDKQEVLLAHRLLAALGDAHTGITSSTVEVHVPAFDGLDGAGLWIANDGGRFVVRAIAAGSPQAERLPLGSELLLVAGRPVGEVHHEVAARLRDWSGWSSQHFLDARLSFQFFPFPEKRRLLSARFLRPDGETIDLSFARGLAPVSRAAATMPAGLETKGAAAARMLDEAVGYVRILGGMNDATRSAFDEALEDIRDAKGVILDCRGMGGGGDYAAWAMCGRFFREPTALEPGARIEPTGTWQLDVPVVMLQDEREVSSAETFTWAMTETGRVVSVGRPTGGATIIPRVFDVPSGIFQYRLGVHDRATPIRRVHPEGVGTAPDVFTPYQPVLLQDGGDPERDVGRFVLERLLAGAKQDALVDAVAGALAFDARRAKQGLDALGAEQAAPVRAWLAPRVEGFVAWERKRREAAPDGVSPAPPDLLERLAALADLLDLPAAAAQARGSKPG